MHDHTFPTLTEERTRLEGLGARVLRVALPLGVLMLAASLLLGMREGDGLRRLSFSYLVNYAFFLSLSLGALSFVAIQHLTRASWSVVIRRLAEILAANLPLLALLSLPILLGLDRIYPWASGEAHGHAELLLHKRPYLNPTFFVIRWVLYFAIWSGFALYFWRRSLQQDASGDPRLTVAMENRSGFALVVFALTTTLASFDLLMSLDPAWFSTIFGVYFFAGGVVAFYALMTLLTIWLQRAGRLARIVSMEHFHDYGKLMFAFVFFWAYIAFSQYMLYWYANIPEETAYLARREVDGWQYVGLVLLLAHFLLPFLGLISRFAKRSRALLGFWAVWLVAAHWVDLYWVAMPELGAGGPRLGLLDATCFLGLGGIYVAGLAWLAGERSLVPGGDPRLQESIQFENA